MLSENDNIKVNDINNRYEIIQKAIFGILFLLGLKSIFFFSNSPFSITITGSIKVNALSMLISFILLLALFGISKTRLITALLYIGAGLYLFISFIGRYILTLISHFTLSCLAIFILGIIASLLPILLAYAIIWLEDQILNNKKKINH